MKKCLFLILIFCLIFCGCKKSETNKNLNSISVNDIVINKSHAYVDEGSKVVLLAQVFPFNSDNQKINWKSDNSKIAEVNDGIVIGKSEGRTVITATSEDGGFSDQCIVFVSTPKLNYEKYQNNLNFETNHINNVNYNNTNNQFGNFNSNKEITNSIYNFINNQINSFYESIKNIQSFFDNVKNKYDISKNENSISNISENNNYFYSYEYIYNSDGVETEEDENIIYKDENTIIKEKIVTL